MNASADNRNLISLEALAELRRQYRNDGKVVVWTNGCFDLFHAGHVVSLQAAARLGHILVVGLNSDRSIRELKGESRPFVPQESRAAVLLALQCVDHVIVFDEKRCTRELEILQPDIYAQGGDYTLETIDPDERRAVESGGGRIEFLPLIEGIRSSLIVKKIRRSDTERITSAAFGIIRDDQGRILLVANRYVDGVRWGLPGGGQRRGERLEETIMRECREEIGLTVRVSGYVGVIERIEPESDLHLVLHLHTLEITGGTLRPNTMDEDIIEAGYFTPAEIREHPGWILGRKQILAYLREPSDFPRYLFMGPGEE